MSISSKPFVLEYIWIDAYSNTRSKTKIVSKDKISDIMKVNTLPFWTFDGSSTGQAEGKYSDVILQPVSLCPDPFRKNDESYLVLCETYNSDGSPHITNHRHNCKKTIDKEEKHEARFGIEQEYILFDKTMERVYRGPSVIQLNEKSFSKKNSKMNNYCSVGGCLAFGREIVEKHLELCLYANLAICGINAEVTPSQWEFQLGILDGIQVSDQLWLARYILHRVCESFACEAVFHPKYFQYINGSGAHTNFSTRKMREEEKTTTEIMKACEKLALNHQEDMKYYGQDNYLRLTGNHETSSFTTFTYGTSDRGASVRIPLLVDKDAQGYLEDRRPGANMDPYLVTERMVRTICGDSQDCSSCFNL